LHNTFTVKKTHEPPVYRVRVLPTIEGVINVYGFMLQVVGVTYRAVDHGFYLPVAGAVANGFAFKLYIVGNGSYFAACAPAPVGRNKGKIKRLTGIHLLQNLPPVYGLLHCNIKLC
jgi:hypothetical protein